MFQLYGQLYSVNMTEFKLVGTNVTNIDPNIVNFPHLEELDLSENQITEISPVLAN